MGAGAAQPAAHLLLLPSFLFAFAFYYFPLLSGIFHSFTYWDIKRTVWVGFDNYVRMFNHPATAAAWRNMAVIVLSQVLVVLTLPLVGVAFVNHVMRGKYFWRIVFVLPIVVPATVTVFVRRWFYGVNGGLNYMLELVGLENLTRTWLGESSTALGDHLCGASLGGRVELPDLPCRLPVNLARAAGCRRRWMAPARCAASSGSSCR